MLLVAFQPLSPSPLNGVWTIDAKTSKLARLLPLYGRDHDLCGLNSQVEGDWLLFRGTCGVFAYDLTKQGNQLLFDGKVALEAGPRRSALQQLESTPGYRVSASEFADVSGPHMTVDGWVYGANPFSRRRYDNGKVEQLPSLRPGRPFFAPLQCLQLLPGEREALIGDSYGLWRVTLKKE